MKKKEKSLAYMTAQGNSLIVLTNVMSKSIYVMFKSGYINHSKVTATNVPRVIIK